MKTFFIPSKQEIIRVYKIKAKDIKTAQGEVIANKGTLVKESRGVENVLLDENATTILESDDGKVLKEF